MPPDPVVTPPGTPSPIPSPALTPETIEPAAGEFTPDPLKSQAENDAAKTAFDAAKEATDKAAKDAADKKTADDVAAAAEKAKNDTKLTPLKLEEIKLPEGFEADKPLQEKFVALVNEEGIPRSAVAKLVALQADAGKAASEANSALWQKTQEEWQKLAKADPEIGGDKLQPNLTLISKAIDHYFKGDADNKAVREAFDLTGAGNNPYMVKLLAKMAGELGEARFVSGSKPIPDKSVADRIYTKQ